MSLFHNNPLIGASGSGTDEYTIERSLRFNDDDSAYLSRTPEDPNKYADTSIDTSTAYRYHRILFEGDANGGSVSEIEFYDINDSKIDASDTNNSNGTVATNATQGLAGWTAFNGTRGGSDYSQGVRKDAGVGSAGFFISKDWGSGNTKTIYGVKVWGVNNYGLAGNTANRYMKLQGSNDNSSWTDLQTWNHARTGSWTTDSANEVGHVSETLASDPSRKTWTWAGWVKRTVKNTSTDQMLFTGGTTNSATGFLALDFNSSDKLRLSSATTNLLLTTAVYRDASAWMHIVLTFDSTQGANADKAKLYVNGSEVTTFDTDGRSGISNQDYGINQAAAHEIGRASLGSNKYLDGYLADVHFIDGQALDPTSFGEFDDNGVFQPIEYTGTYGTNGFHLDFSDNSTAAALGTDTSGNGNTWTVNNITASEYRVIDAPTLSNGAMIVRGVSGGSVSVTISGDGTKNYFTSSDGINWTWQSSATSATYSANYIASGGAGTNSRIAVSNGAFQYAMWNTNTDFDSTSNTTTDTTGLTFTTATANGSNADSLLDSPQNGTQTDTGAGGEVSGNYCTLNPLAIGSFTLSNGNLDVVSTGGYGKALSTFGMSSGKWYFESTMNAANIYNCIGIANTNAFYKLSEYAGQSNTDWTYLGDGRKVSNAGRVAYGSSYTSGDVIGVAFDADAGTLTFYKNGSSQGTAFTGLTSGPYFPVVIDDSNVDQTNQSLNFGQRAFAYSAPSGYKALCTANLPDPTIADGSTYFTTTTYSGNSGDGLSTTQDIVTGFSPDMVWIKHRNGTNSHVIFDTIRGAGKRIFPNLTNSEDTKTQTLSTFNNNGFTLNGDNSVNDVGGNYVAWAWDAGSSTVSNTDGDVISSVRANTSAGFSIVKWNPDSNGQSVGHGLNAVPEFIMAKALDNGHSWRVYHKDLTSGENLLLDTNQPEDVYSADIDIVNSTVFDGGQGLTGSSLNNNIAYCFTSVEGYSAFGSYTGNGIANGPFVYTGFRPRWVLFKTSTETAAGNTAWYIYDAARLGYNGSGTNKSLKANTTDIEANAGDFDLLSNGFKLRNNNGGLNTSNATYIYAAFAENPFKYARAR